MHIAENEDGVFSFGTLIGEGLDIEITNLKLDNVTVYPVLEFGGSIKTATISGLEFINSGGYLIDFNNP
jgi:hypothetical protein